MAKGIIGTKIGMTQIFSENGAVIPVTVVQAGPCVVVQKKTVESDGYNAIQIGFEEILSEKKVNKPMAGHFKKADVKPMKYLREVRVDAIDDYNVGQTISTEIFAEGDLVDIQGVTIGKGFAGGMKRWNFAGGPGGHGSGFHRRLGSIGMKEWPAEVNKGKKDVSIALIWSGKLLAVIAPVSPVLERIALAISVNKGASAVYSAINVHSFLYIKRRALVL